MIGSSFSCWTSAAFPQEAGYLYNHEWPGNVRELENAIEHAFVLGRGDTIRLEDLPESLFPHVK
jgi:DNA-binding NtrC family response regulator